MSDESGENDEIESDSPEPEPIQASKPAITKTEITKAVPNLPKPNLIEKQTSNDNSLDPTSGHVYTTILFTTIIVDNRYMYIITRM